VILLDTSILITDPALTFDAGQECAASILSRAELELGVAVADGRVAAVRRRRLRMLDELFEWLPVTAATTHAYGILAGVLHASAPAQARRIDTYIAAHALELGVPLLTANPKDFERVAHLVTVVAYPRQA